MQIKNVLMAFVLGVVITTIASTVYVKATIGTIYACVKDSNGSVRIVTQNTTCSSNESPLSWNQQGSGGSSFGTYLTDQLNNKDLHSADFTAKNMSGANFSGSEMGDSLWSEADMSNANFTGVNAGGEVAIGTNLTGANFTDANLANRDLSQTTVTGATWNNTTCPDQTNSNDNGNTCVGHLSPQ